MEDYRIDIMIDQGPNARSVRLDIPRFTLIGATTRVGLLSAPMRSRFTLQTRLDYYDREELTKIVLRSCNLLKCHVEKDGASEIAGRARGTPRIANNLIHFARDFAEQRADGKIKKFPETPWNCLKSMNKDLTKWTKKSFTCLLQL